MLRALGLSLLLTILTAGALSAQQQRPDTRRWYEAYEQGRQAVQKKDWPAAVGHLQAALKLRPEQGRRVLFYGSLFDAYIPDYYLGVAFLQLRRYAEADAAFDRASKAGLVSSGDRQYEEFRTQADTAKFEAAFARVQLLAKTGDAGGAIEAAAVAASLGGDPERGRRLNDLIASIPRAPVEPKNDSALEVADSRGPAPIPASRSNINSAPPPVESKPPALSPAPKEAMPPAPRTATVPRPERARPVPPPSPAMTEAAAITAFLSGNYEAAAQALGAIALRPDASPRARFYLACSLAAMVVTGERESASLQGARQLLQAAGPAERFASDRRWISPRILQLLGIPL